MKHFSKMITLVIKDVMSNGVCDTSRNLMDTRNFANGVYEILLTKRGKTVGLV